MAETTVQQYTSTRRLQRVLATNVGGTGPAASLTAPSGQGIFRLTDAVDLDLESHVGAPRRVKIIPCSKSNNGYTLRVFGWNRAGVGDYGGGAWVPVLLYKAVLATPAASGTSASDSTWLDSTDYTIKSITTDAAVPAGAVQAYSASTDGLASYILLDCLGCPIIQFESTRADSFVLAGQVA